MPSVSPASEPDREATASGVNPLQLRIWLRLLTCTQMIERRVRTELRLTFDTTLPRFDVLSQLDGADGDLSMSELSGRLMVSGGNLTSLIDAMERDGLVSRVPHPADRRSILIRVTRRGRTSFNEMVPQHSAWIDAMMGSLSRADMRMLLELLGTLKQSIRQGEAILSSINAGETGRRGEDR